MSQVDAAQAIGVGRRTLQRWESGERAPDVAELRRLCQVYGVNIADLLAENETPPLG